MPLAKPQKFGKTPTEPPTEGASGIPPTIEITREILPQETLPSPSPSPSPVPAGAAKMAKRDHGFDIRKFNREIAPKRFDEAEGGYRTFVIALGALLIASFIGLVTLFFFGS
ncbi:MAG: hypothetical protein Q7S15_02015 [bacterium]|nr:hypothetical protein [bacterium]